MCIENMIYNKDIEEESDTLCEKCGHKMIHYIHGDSSGYICNNCGYGWARQYIDPMLEDETLYTLSFRGMDRPSIEYIRATAEIMQCSYVEASKNLRAGKAQVTLDAKNMFRLVSAFKRKDLVFTISPSFPYQI